MHTPNGWTPRTWGPVARFDIHTPPPTQPAEDPEGRSVIYAGDAIPTALAEAFRGSPVWEICDAWRATALAADDARLHELGREGAAAIGAPADLGYRSDYSRPSTQAWARAILEDAPSGPIAGARYPAARRSVGENVVLWARGAEPVRAASGAAHDASLHTEGLWERVLVAARSLGAVAVRVDRANCTRNHA